MYEFRARERQLASDQHPETHTVESDNYDDTPHPPRRHHCKICNKRFTQRSGLKTHSNTHTGEKPFPCKFGDCKSNFGDPSSCARHRKEVHQEQWVYYKCTYSGCKARNKRRSSFKDHLKTKHGISPKPEDLDRFAVIDAPSKRSAGQGLSSRRDEHSVITDLGGGMTFSVDSYLAPSVGSSSTIPLDNFEQAESFVEQVGSPASFSEGFSEGFIMQARNWTPQPLSTEMYQSPKLSPLLGGQSHTGAPSPCVPDPNYLHPMEAFSGRPTTSLSPAPPIVRQNSPSYAPVGQMGYVQTVQELLSLGADTGRDYRPDFLGLPQVQQHQNFTVPQLLPADSFYASSSPSTPSLSDSAAPSPYPVAPSPHSTEADFLQALAPLFNEHTASLPPSVTRHNSPDVSAYMSMAYTQINPNLKRKAELDDGYELSRRVRSRVV